MEVLYIVRIFLLTI